MPRWMLATILAALFAVLLGIVALWETTDPTANQSTANAPKETTR